MLHEDIHESMLVDTEALRDLLSPYSTETIAGMCSSKLMSWFSTWDEVSPLISPTRQVFFLLGLMLSTEEPAEPQMFGDLEFQKAVVLLNDIFQAYAVMYWPSPEEEPQITDDWRHVREVSMPAFLHYFNTTLMASVEQIIKRVERYLAPFDSEFEEIAGLSATEALEITRWITKTFEQGVIEMQDAARQEYEARLRFLERTEAETWSIERMRKEASQGEYYAHGQRMMKALNDFLKVDKKVLVSEFGEEPANAYWTLFVSERGDSPEFTYMTEHNAAEEKPLFTVNDGSRALCPFANSLYAAVLLNYENMIQDSSFRDRFFRRRDRELEQEVEETFGKLFTEGAEFHPHVFETQDLQHEHDLVIIADGALLIIEAKASPPVEPFRDPDKAFERISRRFRSDRGIQGGYGQAMRILGRLLAGESVSLYDENRREAASISPADLDRCYAICVTRDDFGPISVDLSLLLTKSANEPYPWAINILDLNYLIDAWTYLDLGPDQLYAYLDSRLDLHGRIIAFDELDLAGAFLQHAGLEMIPRSEGSRTYFSETYSDVFDKIYDAQRGGPEFKLTTTEPVLVDVKEKLKELSMEQG